MKLIPAIAKMEGFGADASNVPTRCNNPGDICAGQFANAHGAIPGAHDPGLADDAPEKPPFRYAVFPTAQVGENALRVLLNEHYAGKLLADALARYAPATENDTHAYLKSICKWTGMTPSTILTPENIG